MSQNNERAKPGELKPCPFCGSADVANVSAGHAGPTDRWHAGDEIFAVNCKGCGASVPNRYRNNLVVDAWNARAAIAAQAGQSEPVAHQYQAEDGTWHPFMNDAHRENTIADGRWPIRALYTGTAPVRQPLTEKQQVDCLVKSGCIGTVRMSFESGPYDITRPSINASRLIDAVEAAHGITAQEGRT